jgi:site-specific DNA recombinase
MTGRLRCAIYTRKSTDEGLEQDFNSLDAQREACEAYIKSQTNEGWSLVKGRYDDGAYSGGHLNRPAIQELLKEIKLNRVDVIVVYKVDRLTRSLADFAKLVELFDKHGVSFVSVTQAFNTTTSMGRLTLNVLLSFAQFEREVTAERIRDKIAASKKKGMWMGGPVPLGYDVTDKKLIINERESAQVQRIFDLYLSLDNVRVLKGELDALNIRTKRQVYRTGREVGNCAFTRGRLYHLLKNPLYIGKVRHKDEAYDGQHQPIIAEEIWEAVQAKLEGRSHRKKDQPSASKSMLTGLIFDEKNKRLTPSHAVKGTKRYRYYISASLSLKRTDEDSKGWRLPARSIEKLVIESIHGLFQDQLQLMQALYLDEPNLEEMDRLKRFTNANGSKALKGMDVTSLIRRVTVFGDKVQIDLDIPALRERIGFSAREGGRKTHRLTIPIKLRRRGVERKIVILGSTQREVGKSSSLLNLIARSIDWFENLKCGETSSLEEIAKKESMSASDVSRYLPLAFLAPDIVASIAKGRQPIELNVQRIKRLSPLPVIWDEQRRLLGYAA